MTVHRFAALVLATLATAACAESTPTELPHGGPSFAHESNNRAELSGMQNGNTIRGQAIINYVAGTDGWRSTVNLRGKLAAGTYTFFAISPDGLTAMPVCSFTLNGRGGRQGCSADTDLGGFATAEVRDAAGNVVASGLFDRRGGARFN